jgi:hypothetical protein
MNNLLLKSRDPRQQLFLMRKSRFRSSGGSKLLTMLPKNMRVKIATKNVVAIRISTDFQQVPDE